MRLQYLVKSFHGDAVTFLKLHFDNLVKPVDIGSHPDHIVRETLTVVESDATDVGATENTDEIVAGNVCDLSIVSLIHAGDVDGPKTREATPGTRAITEEKGSVPQEGQVEKVRTSISD